MVTEATLITGGARPAVRLERLLPDPPEVVWRAITEREQLAFTWGEEILRFELRAEGDGTRLVLTDELPGSIAARNAAGWDECLDRLAGLGGGTWQARFERYSAVFEPELGPQDGPPAGYQG